MKIPPKRTLRILLTAISNFLILLFVIMSVSAFRYPDRTIVVNFNLFGEHQAETVFLTLVYGGTLYFFLEDLIDYWSGEDVVSRERR